MAYYDVILCRNVHTKTKPPALGSPELDAWLAKESRGEVTLDGDTLVAVRGAKFALCGLPYYADIFCLHIDFPDKKVFLGYPVSE